MKQWLTIFEGPDGSGKSTLAAAFTRRTQAIITHHGSYLNTERQKLPYLYELSMRPAADLVNDVVLDRCWLSEPPYADAFRGGNRRLSSREMAVLDRYALRSTQALVVLCIPPFETCLASWKGRPGEEYLKQQEQLEKVWNWYAHDIATYIPIVKYDRTKDNMSEFAEKLAKGHGARCR